MKLILKLGTISLLLYFIFMKHSFSLVAFADNRFSYLAVRFIQAIPSIIVTIIFLLLLLIIVYSFFFDTTFSRITSFLIVTTVFELGLCLAFSEYTLDDTTPFLFCAVIHPIDITTKLNFFNGEVIACYDAAYPHLTQVVAPEQISKLIEAKFNLAHLANLNAPGISQYARQLFLASIDNYNSSLNHGIFSIGRFFHLIGLCFFIYNLEENPFFH